MSVLFPVSYIVLWVIVIALCFLVVGLLQQVGILQQRLHSSSTPEGNHDLPELPSLENDGPVIGAYLPELTLETIDHASSLSLTSPLANQKTLLFFLSPTCESCQHLVAPINALIERGIYDGRAIAILKADEYAARGYLSLFPLHIPTICDQDSTIIRSFGVHRTPFALLYDEQGLLIKKGIVQEKAELLTFLEENRALPSSDGIAIS